MVEVVHTSVLRQEVLDLLAPDSAGTLFIDTTLGEGGHTASILESFPDARVIGLDADHDILEVARARLSEFGSRVTTVHAWFNQFFSEYPIDAERPARVLFDLGVSSFHYEKSGRGFSFRSDELLDMRLDEGLEISAYHVVNEYPEPELASLIYEFGEERYSRRIARAIVESRAQAPIRRSVDLANVISSSVPPEYRRARIHPATRTFQALRIAVNGELARLSQGLESALRILVPGGRIGVIAFHSLEDRIVKRFFREKNRECTCPPEWPACRCGGKRIIEIVTKRPVRPTQREIATNPASRSARLRVAEKVNEEQL